MSEVANLDILIRAINATNAGITQAQSRVRALSAETNAMNARSASSAKATAAAEAAQMRSRMASYGRLQSSLRLIGSTMTTYVTLPAGVAAGALGYVGYNYEKSMQRISGINRQSAADMAVYRAQINVLAKETGQVPTKLADALYYVTSTGLRGQAALNMMRVSSHAAAAGLGDVMTVADNLTTITNAYGRSNLSAARAMDILIAAIRVGRAEPEEFASAIGQIAANAAHLKVPFEQVAAAVANMTLKGLSTSQAVVSLNQFMMGLGKGTEAGAKYLKSVGSSYADLRKELADKGLIPTLRTILDLSKGNEEVMQDIIPNIRATRAVWGLLSGDGAQLARVFREVKDSSGEANDAFARWEKSPVAGLEKAWGKFMVAVTQAGSKILPVLSDALGVVNALIDAFRGLPEWAQDAGIGIGVFAAALGPLATLTSTVFAGMRTFTSMSLGRKLAQIGEGLGSAVTPATSAGAVFGRTALSLTRLAGAVGLASGAVVGAYALTKWLDDRAKAARQAKRDELNVSNMTEGVESVYRRLGGRKMVVDGIVVWEFTVVPKEKPRKTKTGGQRFADYMKGLRNRLQQEAEAEIRDDKLEFAVEYGIKPLENKRANLVKARQIIQSQIDNLIKPGQALTTKEIEVKANLEFALENLDRDIEDVNTRIETGIDAATLPPPVFSTADRAIAAWGKGLGALGLTPPKMPTPSGADKAAAAAMSTAQSYINGHPLVATVHVRPIVNLGGVVAAAQSTLRSGFTAGGGAHGGIFTGPNSGYFTLMHGTEAIIPLDRSKSSDAQRVLSQAGMVMGGNRSSRAGSQVNVSLTIRGPFYGGADPAEWREEMGGMASDIAANVVGRRDAELARYDRSRA